MTDERLKALAAHYREILTHPSTAALEYSKFINELLDEIVAEELKKRLEELTK